MALLERFTSVSKSTFLATKIIPANPNDAHYDGRCTFCWEQYTEEHQGVRVLPCNHVFGADCLQTMTESTDGHLCPLCRCILFRPSWKAFISEVVWRLEDRIMLQFQAWYWSVIAFNNSLPPRVQQTLRLFKDWLVFYIYARNPYFWASVIVACYTDLGERVPSLSLWYPQLALNVLRFDVYWPISRYVRYGSENLWRPTATTSIIEIGISVGVVFYVRCTGLDGVCPCKHESSILTSVMLLSILIAHLPNFWTLWWVYHQQDPLWIMYAANEKSPVLGFVLSVVLGAIL